LFRFCSAIPDIAPFPSSVNLSCFVSFRRFCLHGSFTRLRSRTTRARVDSLLCVVRRGEERAGRRRFREERTQRKTEMQELPVVLGERVSRIADAFGILLSRRCELFAVARHVVEPHKLQIRNVETKNCLDTMGRKSGENLGMTYCHNLGGNQVFAYTKRQQIMSDDNCLDASNKNGPIKLVRCHGMGGNQAWAYDQVVSGGA
jgi:hypothetical protein